MQVTDAEILAGLVKWAFGRGDGMGVRALIVGGEYRHHHSV